MSLLENNFIETSSFEAISDGFLARAWHALDIALQPIISIQTGTTYAYEALMRGHEKLELESIEAVLNTAHTFGISDKLYLLLLEKALKKFSELENANETKLFYNLDGRALDGNTNLLPETMMLLTNFNVAPSALCLEFSETYDYTSAITVAEMVKQHRANGINFAIDDFGRGFSELKVLYEYHPEYIKIDRFFIQEIVAQDRKRLFVETVINLAHVLGIKVVAEGIETEDEFHLCRKLGSDLAQGYLISKPQLSFPNHRFECSDLRQQLMLQRNRRSIKNSLVHQRIEVLAPLKLDSDIDDIFEVLKNNRKSFIIPILNASNEPEGIIHEHDLKEYIYSPFGKDLLKNTWFSKKMRDFIRPCSIADITASADRILDIFTYQSNSDGIIVTNDSKYVGFISALSLLEILNDNRLEAARDQNPLSKLPGNSSIDKYWDEICLAKDIDRAICYFDFDNFKPFNDRYSFRDGDKAIVMFANILRREFSGNKYKIGHIGGDDFFIAVKEQSSAELLDKLKKVRELFQKSAESLYTSQDRSKGFIEGRDRYGKVRRFPLLSCSIAMLEVPKGRSIRNLDGIFQDISRLKTIAKRSEEGIVSERCCHSSNESNEIESDHQADQLFCRNIRQRNRVA